MQTNKIFISPSILSCDFANLEREIKMLEQSGADWIHVDVMDGHFVPNLTIGAPVVKALKKVASVPLDVHLMIDNPEKYIEDFVNAGADIITFHYEAAKSNTDSIIKLIKSFGVKAGISIKPKTSVKSILPFLNDADLILIMTVEPGFGAQSFMPECLEKIPELKNYLHKDIIIEADGGININTAKFCKNLGVNALVAGNYIFTSNDRKEAIASLR